MSAGKPPSHEEVFVHLTHSVIGIVEVRLTKSHADVRDLLNQQYLAFRPENQVLYNVDMTQKNYLPTPCIISVSQQATLQIDLSYDSSLGGKTATLSGNLPYRQQAGITFTSGSFTFDADATQLTVTVNINGPTGGAPWSVWDVVSWELQVDGAAAQISDPAWCYLQIYAVVDDLAPFFQEAGIPLQLLQWMVHPAAEAQCMTLDSWIPFIVQQCFCSRFDPVGSNKDVAIHSYLTTPSGMGNPTLPAISESILIWMTGCLA